MTIRSLIVSYKFKAYYINMEPSKCTTVKLKSSVRYTNCCKEVISFYS